MNLPSIPLLLADEILSCASVKRLPSTQHAATKTCVMLNLSQTNTTFTVKPSRLSSSPSASPLHPSSSPSPPQWPPHATSRNTLGHPLPAGAARVLVPSRCPTARGGRSPYACWVASRPAGCQSAMGRAPGEGLGSQAHKESTSLSVRASPVMSGRVGRLSGEECIWRDGRWIARINCRSNLRLELPVGICSSFSSHQRSGLLFWRLRR